MEIGRTTPRGISELLAKSPNIWHELTCFMKGSFLTKMTGRRWNHWMTSSTDEYKSPDKTGEETGFRGNALLAFMFPKDTRTFSPFSTGSERTEQAMDTSSHVLAVMDNLCIYADRDQIIGELQFCYITGMVLGNLACLEHWAHIIRIVFRAFRLALAEPVFFRQFIKAVHAQFMYDEAAFESSILEYDNDMRDEVRLLLTTFKSRLNELLMAQGSAITDEQSDVGKAFEDLESWLWRWNWDLRGNYVRSGKIQLEDGEFVDAELKDFEAEDERGEYAPVVVEMDEDGREKGLIRF